MRPCGYARQIAVALQPMAFVDRKSCSVAAGCEQPHPQLSFKLAGGHIARDDHRRRAAVGNDEFDHFVTGVLGDGTGGNLTLGLVGMPISWLLTAIQPRA